MSRPSRRSILRAILISIHALHATSFAIRPCLTTTVPSSSVTQQYASSSSSTTDSDLTDWVIEDLEDDGQSITSIDPIQAGEGDTLPVDGLAIGKVKIFASSHSPECHCDDTNFTNESDNTDDADDDYYPIYILLGRNGWGTGVHPTTRLCLEWLCTAINDGDILLDYGCGSGVLSIASLQLGAARCIGVDVEAEALVTAERNVALNGWDDDSNGVRYFEGLHTREVLPYEVCPPNGVDACVANILVGQLVRPSMVAAIVTNIRDGGLLCLSGIRPGGEVDSLKEAYGDRVEWLDDQYAELSAFETANCIESYGFDCGRWARLVGRKRKDEGDPGFIEQMSDLAVS